MMDLRQAVVVVTGASGGIGRATALLFARNGASLVLAARQNEALERVGEECRRLGSSVLCVPTDAGVAEQVDALARNALATFGRIDVWVNAAAVLAFGRIEDVPAGDLERMIRTNVFGYVCGTRAAMRQFRQQGRGVLVNVGSVLGTVGAPYAAVYSAAKWAIRGLTESVRDELRDQPAIHACTVLPAAIDTPIFRHAANYTGRQPRGPEPLYSPARVAAAVVGLARRPRRERVVGGFGFLPRLGHAIFPSLTERIVTAYISSRQFEEGAAATPTHGNLFEPASVADRSGVESGRANWDRLDQIVLGGAIVATLYLLTLRLRKH
jgi:short-subunit dehydrogenase